MKSKGYAALLVCITICLCCLGCHNEEEVQTVTRNGDELTVAILDEQYYILGSSSAGDEIAAVCPAEISLMCTGTLTEPMSSEFDGSFTIESELINSYGKANITGLKRDAKWMITAKHVVENEEGQWELSEVLYQIYSGNDVERDGVLIMILGHDDTVNYAVKGNDPEEALEKYEKLWGEVFNPKS